MFVLSNPFSTHSIQRRSVRSNPPTPWLIAGGAALLVLAGSGVAYAYSKRNKDLPKPPKGGPDLPCDPAPYEVDIEELEIFVNEQIDNGETDKATVMQNLADTYFGKYPNGGQTIVFPPAPNAPMGVGCVWQIVVIVVDDIFKKRNVPESPTPTGSLQWVVHGANDPGYPWEEPTLHTTNFPTPGTYLDVNNSDMWHTDKGLDSMVRAALGSALAMAGADVSLANLGNQSTRSKQLKQGLRNAIIIPDGWNDRLYGQTNANYAGGNDPGKPGGDANKAKVTYMMNSEGRGLNWLARHADNIARIPQGISPKRTTKLDGAKLGGSNSGNQHMLIWIPALDLSALQGPVPTIGFLKWSDGSSTLKPPPQIQALGIDMSGVSL